ncbi:MAG: GWxTD domain-containing protein [Candidatus Aminicenantes bacterium]|nr:GWxTD domain-containing protein [Candidatus Aminicenantes bacterium]
MKKNIFDFFSVFLGFFFLGPTLFFAAEKINYRKWLSDEVYWLITPEEIRDFKKLKSDKERNEFIALFWAKRDPTPLTEANEFKDAYYANLAYVNRQYSRGQDMGWKTDVGKVLLFFGLPRERTANPETWVYDPIPHLKIDSEFTVVFDPVQDIGFALNQNLTSRTALQAMDEYAYRTIQHPGLNEVPDYRKPPGEESRGFEKEILEKASAGGSEGGGIPFDTAVFYAKAEEGKTSLTLVNFFGREETGFDTAVLFGKVVSADGKTQEYRRQVRLKKGEDFALVVLPLSPARYEIVSAIKDASSGKYAVLKKDLDVPDFWREGLALGSLILSDRVESITAGAAEFSAFNFGQYLAVPKKDGRFNKTDALNIAFQIYNAATSDRRVRLVQEISLKSSVRTYRLPEQLLEHEVPQGQAIVSGIPVPLAQVEPGDYLLHVKITDQIGRTSAEATAKLTILE